MVVFENVKPLKAAQVIAQRIRDAVLAGTLSVGDRLPTERDLIKQFGYSRAAVREGLRLLEADGLVTVQAGRNGGAVIRNPEPDRLVSTLDMILRLQSTTIHDVHEAQRLIEPLVIKLAIENATPSDLAGMRRTIEQIELNPSDPEAVRVQSNLFHVLLGEATHNNVIGIMSSLIRQVVVQMGYKGDEAEALTIARAHRRMLDAIEAGDVGAATRRALRHLDATECVLHSRQPGQRQDPVVKRKAAKTDGGASQPRARAPRRESRASSR